MINQFIQTYKNQSRSIIYYAVGLFLYLWMLIALFPSLKTVNLDQYLNTMPKEFLQFVSGGEAISYSHIEGFISMEFLSIMFVLVLVIYLGSAAGSTVAGAIEKRTMDFTLSQPISRSNLLISESLVALINIATLVAVTSIAIALWCLVYNVDINRSGLITFTVGTIPFLWSLYGIAILLSSFLKNKMQAAMATLLVTIAFYVFSSLGGIVNKIKDYEKFSLFHFYKPQSWLTNGIIDWWHIVVLLIIFSVCLIGSLIIFNRRDV